MNREILFKAKQKNGEGWISGYYVYDYKHNVHYIFSNRIVCPNCINDNRQEYSLTDHDVNPDTICQYTGLTDKNGNKIWENDVVSEPTYGDLYIVKWDYEAACFALERNGIIMCDFYYYTHYDLTIRGNIFDNPELLEV